MMKPEQTKKVAPVAMAAAAGALCPAEAAGHEHIPHKEPFDFYAGADQTTVMDTSKVVAGLPIVDLANPNRAIKRLQRSVRRSRRS
jgi:hypothetical protein